MVLIAKNIRITAHIFNTRVTVKRPLSVLLFKLQIYDTKLSKISGRFSERQDYIKDFQSNAFFFF